MSTSSGSVSIKSKILAPDAIERCSWVYCCVKLRIGSKNLCTYMTKATNTPGSNWPSSNPTNLAPKNSASPMATAVRISTAGNRPAAYLPAITLDQRWAVFFSSNISRFLSCLLRLCTTRTPEMFSLNAAFTMEIRLLISLKVLFAYFCQITITAIKTGSTAMVMSPNSRSITRRAMTIPIRLNSSPRLMTTSAANSCSWPTSPWTRDMSRPTSVLSKYERDCFCTCPNKALLNRKRTPCPTFCMAYCWR